MAVDQLSMGCDDGTVLGQSASDKIALYGADPVVQADALTAPVSTAATATTPYGYTQAQADAIVTWIRAADTALKNLGIIASS